MIRGKKGEVDNKFLLVVLLVVAVVILSNNGFFSGRAVDTSYRLRRAVSEPQAIGSGRNEPSFDRETVYGPNPYGRGTCGDGRFDPKREFCDWSTPDEECRRGWTCNKDCQCV